MWPKQKRYFRGPVVDHRELLAPRDPDKRLKAVEVQLVRNDKARLTLTCEDGSYVSFSIPAQ